MFDSCYSKHEISMWETRYLSENNHRNERKGISNSANMRFNVVDKNLKLFSRKGRIVCDKILGKV